MDRNHDSTIQFNEFYRAIKRYPILFEVFAGTFPISIRYNVDVVTESGTNSGPIDSRAYIFTWDHLRKLWFAMIREGESHVDQVNLKGFRAIMTKFFGSGSALLAPLIERMFHYFDRNHDDAINLREFLT